MQDLAAPDTKHAPSTITLHFFVVFCCTPSMHTETRKRGINPLRFARGKSKREDGSNFTDGMMTGLAALGAGLRGGEAFDCLLTGVALDASALGTGDDVTATSTATSGPWASFLGRPLVFCSGTSSVLLGTGDEATATSEAWASF